MYEHKRYPNLRGLQNRELHYMFASTENEATEA
jgi:hypothetical protein